MRKMLIMFVVLLLILAFAPAVFADQSPGVVLYGDAQNGSVSYGCCGQSWYSAEAVSPDVVLPEIAVDNQCCLPDCTVSAQQYGSLCQNYSLNGEWVFYKDARGVLHYLYIDPNREGSFQPYTDENGVTQYNYVYSD